MTRTSSGERARLTVLLAPPARSGRVILGLSALALVSMILIGIDRTLETIVVAASSISLINVHQ
jgi:hypothetical protein